MATAPTYPDTITCDQCNTWAADLGIGRKINRWEVMIHHAGHEPPRSQRKRHREWERTHPGRTRA